MEARVLNVVRLTYARQRSDRCHVFGESLPAMNELSRWLGAVNAKRTIQSRSDITSICKNHGNGLSTSSVAIVSLSYWENSTREDDSPRGSY